MNTRRSFLKSMLAAVAMAPVICRLAEEEAVSAPAEMAKMEITYPDRFFFDEHGRAIMLDPLREVHNCFGIETEVNPDWMSAPYEAEIWFTQSGPLKVESRLVHRCVPVDYPDCLRFLS